MRTTKKEVENSFKAFIKAINGKVATSYNDVGAYDLDHNSTYGGYVIERVHNEHGGVSHPFGDTRRNASEMASTLWFAASAIDKINK